MSVEEEERGEDDTSAPWRPYVTKRCVPFSSTMRPPHLAHAERFVRNDMSMGLKVPHVRSMCITPASRLATTAAPPPPTPPSRKT